MNVAGRAMAALSSARSVVNAVTSRNPCAASIVPTATRSRRCIIFITKSRAACCARVIEFGEENVRSNNSMKLRRAAGLSGDVALSEASEV